jgi:hypothetical protein
VVYRQQDVKPISLWQILHALAHNVQVGEFPGSRPTRPKLNLDLLDYSPIPKVEFALRLREG